MLTGLFEPAIQVGSKNRRIITSPRQPCLQSKKHQAAYAVNSRPTSMQ